MSRYGHNSDARQGERDFERNGRYGYEERRYANNRDYQEGFDEARRADDRMREDREDREAEEAAEKQAEYRAAQCRREQEAEEQEAEEQEAEEND